MARVRNLVTIYSGLGGGGRGRRTVSDQDVLRAAVVFLHASLEEYFREALRAAWPKAGKEVLDDVPFSGLNTSRVTKFTLGDLAQFRGKSVQDLIDQSVDAYANVYNLNNSGDLASVLKTLGVDLAMVNGHFAQVEPLMKRRHHIVHQADRSTNAGSGNHDARSLRVGQVTEWADAVEAFLKDVDAEREE